MISSYTVLYSIKYNLRNFRLSIVKFVIASEVHRHIVQFLDSIDYFKEAF